VRFELTEPEGSAVFKTAPFDRSGTPPLGTVWQEQKEGARGGTMGSPAMKTGPFDRSGTPPLGTVWQEQKGGGSWGNHGFPHDEDRPVRPLRHLAAPY
jgi:hypothetical protein